MQLTQSPRKKAFKPGTGARFIDRGIVSFWDEAVFNLVIFSSFLRTYPSEENMTFRAKLLIPSAMFMTIVAFQNCNRFQTEQTTELVMSHSKAADTSKSIRESLVQGNIAIFQFIRDHGTLNAGSKAIVSFQDETTHTKIIGAPKARGYPNARDEILDQNLISLWGAKFALIESDNGFCLARDEVCYAHFLKFLFDDDLTEEQYSHLIERAFSDLKTLRNRSPTSLCTIDGKPVYAKYATYRYLGEFIFRNVKVLELIPNQSIHDAYLNQLKDAVAFLQENYLSDFTKTEYYTCTRATEFMTGYLVARGLNEYWKHTGSSDVALKDYIVSILKEIQGASHARTVREMADEAPSRKSVYANAQAQYVEIQLLREELGIEELPAREIDGIVKNIVYAQSLNTSRATSDYIHNQDQCNQSTINGIKYTMTFGGWPHGVHLQEGDGDCKQSMSYHVLTVDPLISLYQRINKTGSCDEKQFPYACKQLIDSIRASLAYFAAPSVVDLDKGIYYELARGSVPEDQFAVYDKLTAKTCLAIDFLDRTLPIIPKEKIDPTALIEQNARIRQSVWNRRGGCSYLPALAFSKVMWP